MKRTLALASLAAVVLLASRESWAQGSLNVYCSVQAEWCQAIATEFQRQSGIKVAITQKGSGEVLAQVQLYAPVFAGDGELIGYEEQVRDGSVIRDLNGRPIGSRWSDLRSRSMNPNNKGITIVFHSRPSERTTMAAAPSIDDLMHLARIN